MAHGDTVFDFESDTTGQAPTGWTIPEDNANARVVTTTNEGSYAGGKAIRTTATGNLSILGRTADLGSVTGLQADIRWDVNTGTLPFLNVGGWRDADSSGTFNAHAERTFGSGMENISNAARFNFVSGNSTRLNGTMNTAFVANKWYRVTMTWGAEVAGVRTVNLHAFNLTDNTDLGLVNSTTATSAQFGGDPTTWDGVAIRMTRGTIDNITVIPEPSMKEATVYFVGNDPISDELYLWLSDNFAENIVAGQFTAGAPAAGPDDVVVITRSTNSADYANTAAEIDSWNALPCKVFLANSYIARGSRWGWISSGTITTATSAGSETNLVAPADPIFSGIPSNPADLYVNPFDVVINSPIGGGTLLAAHSAGIVGVRYAAGSALATTTPNGFAVTRTTHAGARIHFALPSNETALTENGMTVLKNIMVNELGLTPMKRRPTTAGAPIAEGLPTGVFGYEHFKLNHGLGGSDSIAADDKDGDGFANLLEFAFGLDPTIADPGSEGLTAGFAESTGDFGISFRRRNDAPHLEYIMESSNDLQEWEPCTPGQAGVEQESITHAVKRVKATVNTAVSDLRLFRLGIDLDDAEIHSVITIDNQADFDACQTRTFEPGDLILFKRGQIFSGMFAPQGSGTASQPIRIASYGEGAMPIINALGVNKAAIHLKNVEYWEVHNIEVTNTDGTDNHQGKINGIYVETDNNRPHTVMNHIHIKHCHVHDVNGITLDSHPDEAKGHGGIHVHTFGTIPTMIHDLRIVGNTIERTGGVGIGTNSGFNGVNTNEIGHLWTGVYIAHNFISNTSRNNMIIRQSLNPLIEYNVLANSSRHNTGHSLFNFHTVGFTAQHNEAYGNTGAGGMDRGGFDADYNARDTTFQYNYSHDNLWFIGIMKRWNKTVDVRYNISQNDRHGFIFFGFDNDTACENVRIYNNVYYAGPGITGAQFVAENRKPHNTRFYNNIFHFANGGSYGSGMNTMQNVQFSHNAYFGIPAHPGDANAVTTDPMMVAPGSGRTNIDMTDPGRLAGYGLKPGSPCIDAGRSNGAGYVFGGRDFWGNPVPAGAGIDIGVHEFQPE